MKVGLIIYGRLSTISGGYLYDRKLVDYLRAQGDDVTILSLPWSRYGHHLTHNLSRRLHQTLRQAAFDLLLQDELNHPSLFWLNRQLKRAISYPLISIVHHLRSSEAHPAWQQPLYKQVERTYLQTIDGFVFNSQTTKQVVEARVGHKRPSVVAYPGGNRLQPTITPEEINVRAKTPGPLRVLFVGSLIQRKGLHTLIAALAPMNQAEWRLSVVGNTAVDPVYTAQIKRHISQAGLTRQITLHGLLPDEQLAHQFRQSHLLCVPSQYEGFGIVYLEGMGFGLPAIGSRTGAACEIIDAGKTGYLVGKSDHSGLSNHDQAATLTQHLQHLQQNRDKLAELSLQARCRFLAHPTWQESMTAVRTFLQAMATSAAAGDHHQ